MKYLYIFIILVVIPIACSEFSLLEEKLEERNQEKLSVIHNPQINDIYMYTFPFDPFGLANKEHPVQGYKLIKVEGDMRYFATSEYSYGSWNNFLNNSYPPHVKMVFIERIVSAPLSELESVVTSRTNVNESRVTIYREDGEVY